MGPQWVKDYMLSLFTLTVYITWMTGTIPLCTSTNLLYPKRSMLCNSSWLYSGQISPPVLQSSNVCHVYFYWICNKQFLNLESWILLQLQFTDGFGMMHKAWCSIEEVPYYFTRSSIQFQGHTGWKIYDLNPIWVRFLSNPSDLPCCFKKSRF